MIRRLLSPTLLACTVALAGCAASTPTYSSGAGGTTSPSATGSTPASSPTPTPSATTEPDCRKLKCIALTYDDGPSTLTPQLLKAFTDRKATATLFMLGNAAETYPETVRKAHQQGFEIANHTYDHKPISGLSDEKVAWEVAQTNKALARITGQTPTLMRPPYAARTSRTDRVVGRNGLAVVVWNNSPEDWVASNQSAEAITRLTLQRSSRNSIILMHDIHPWTVEAAPAIIDGLHEQGYTLVTVSQLLGSTTPGAVHPKA
ncbi:polysaccharide deacetylase family protein [Luteococcus sp.]|uniref:polysaccharide deacetylase family protein n=1 Tax=Luteococcus sp. TaxID=1969402 RepID=UPI003734D632